jgi:hypothetical protein
VKTETAVGWKPECHEIEPSPSKDKAMPEGGNPSFCTSNFGKISKFASEMGDCGIKKKILSLGHSKST